MISYMVYLVGVVTLVLHFTGVLACRNLPWLVLVAPVVIFTVNILAISASSRRLARATKCCARHNASCRPFCWPSARRHLC
jgi:hypothetical protein